MKNATRPPKRKLLGFAEQLGSTPVPMAPGGVGLTKSPIPEGPRPAAAKANKTKASALPGEAREIPPAPPVAESAVSKPTAPAPVKVPSPAPIAKKKRGGGPNKFVLMLLVVVAIVVAGPFLAMLIGMFAYPLIVLAGIAGIWMLFDSTRSKAK
jgi:hypothetical protein